jgi:hypothetical protein
MSRDREGVIMALRAWASLARLDKLKLIPRGACFSLPAGRQPGLGPRATKGDEARPAMFFNRAVLFADSARTLAGALAKNNLAADEHR